MKKSAVFVTGSGGFIGLELCDHLESGGHRVTGVDISYAEGVAETRPHLHVTDYRDSAALRELLEGHDAVVHLASAHLDLGMSDDAYRDVNVNGLDDLLTLCREAGVRRFCHVSSVAVYGNLTSWPATEETPCRPQSIYGATKLEGEGRVREHAAKSDMEIIILRPTWVYGASCPRTRRLIRTLRKKTFFMIGRGNNVRHPIYIKDLLHFFDLALQRPIETGDLLIAGGPEVVSTQELVEAVCEVFDVPRPRVRMPMWAGELGVRVLETGSSVLGIKPPLTSRSLEFFNTNNGFDLSRARSRLGFEPRFTLREGLADVRHILEQDTSEQMKS